MDFRSRAVRSLVELHDRELRAFLVVFERFRTAGCTMPDGHGDPAYAAPGDLAAHVLRAAARYLTWIGECLGRPATDFDSEGRVERIAAQAAEYLAEVLAAWRRHLVLLTDAEIAPATFTTRWGESFTIETMLEHAVVHPMRHRIQLERILEGRG